MSTRFTLDGSDKLELYLSQLCNKVRARILVIVPPEKLEALVLGGGYGRGEGGVLRDDTGEHPYNDLEFYVFMRGSRLRNETAFHKSLGALGEQLSSGAGLHVEFKIDSLAAFRQRAVSMFSYDLVHGYKLLFGKADLFHGCEHHREAKNIPLSEATRLLLNRCSGLLLVRELLSCDTLTATGSAGILPASDGLSSDVADFIGRNLAKAQLAIGDALLLAFGLYDWSCLCRGQRLQEFAPAEPVPQLERIRDHHAAGVRFKLHPERASRSKEQFSALHRDVCALAAELWLWLESRRLKRSFGTIKDYALDRSRKCSGTSFCRNLLLSIRTFGLKSVLNPLAARYPRERLFNSLPLLLWNGEISREPEIRHHLQRQLVTTAADRAGLIAAYKQVWPNYG